MHSFQEIATRIPVNKEAAFALVPSESFTFGYGNRLRSATPLPMVTGTLPKENHWGIPLENLTGYVFGRLTVVGLLHDPSKEHGKKLRWVVRCTCGYYETRRNRGIKKLNTQQQMCCQCEALERHKLLSAHGTYDERRERAGKYHPRRAALYENTPSSMDDVVCDEPFEIHPSTPRFYKKTPIPPELRWAVWERDNFTCQHCGSRKHLAVDHILAESKGGLMVLSNLQTLYNRCNSKKGAR